MPIYEYYCARCQKTFDLLRPFSKADAPATCPDCQGLETKRGLSRFAFLSGNGGNGRESAGSGGGCAGCSASSCATCKR